MKRAFWLLLLLPTFALARRPDIKTSVLTVKPGQNVLVQMVPAADGAKPTFLFMPGVNRSVMLNEPAAVHLIDQGYGVVAFNFSVQPLSVATLPDHTRPGFYTDAATLDTLAEETALVANQIKLEHGVASLIPVSLSYSGAVSRHLQGFFNVIDAVPLTSMDAFSPQFVAYRNWLKLQALVFDPLGVLGYVRTWLDVAYKNAWGTQVSKIIEQFDLPTDRRDVMVEGYTQLSRAAEEFDWNSTGDRMRRTFILAAKENPILLGHQLDVIVERVTAQLNESIVLVEESGHVVPLEQPAIYAQILAKMAGAQLKPGLTVVTPSTNTWTHLDRLQTLAKLRTLRRDLPGVPSGSSDRPGDGTIHGTL